MFKIITNKIKYLFQMSILIRKSTNRDRLFRARTKEVVTFKLLYRNHVGEKYSWTNPTILDNLVMEIVKRKIELMSHERHHIKLSQDLNKDSERKNKTVFETIVSDFKNNNIDFDDLTFTSVLTQTSYVLSFEEGHTTVSVPPPSKDYEYEEPFECLYYYFIIIIKNKRSWIRYVFKDLVSYFYIFKDCTESKRIFDNRHEWFKHELKTYLRKDIVMNVLTNVLYSLYHEEMSIDRFERHLTRHLEELILFVIVRSSDELKDSDQS